MLILAARYIPLYLLRLWLYLGYRLYDHSQIESEQLSNFKLGCGSNL